jgi:DNA (cytosine-5)-methyltransferase 1
MKNGPLTVDLFCGSGGLSKGLQQAGYKIAVGIDKNENAIRTYNKNHNSKGVRADIREIDQEYLYSLLEDQNLSPSDIDVVAGGPPCKGFSQANRKTRNSSNAMNELYKDFLRVVELLNPQAVIIENVPNFLQMEDGFYKDSVISKLNKMGYEAEANTLRADQYGVPQRRERAFILGSLCGVPSFPEPQFSSSGNDLPDPPTVAEAILDLPELPTGGGGSDEMDYNPNPDKQTTYVKRLRKEAEKGNILNHRSSNNRERTYRRFEHIPQGGNWKDIPPELMKNYSDRSQTHDNIYHRLEGSDTSLTVTNFRKQMMLHPTQDRLLSIREAARLQSFPDSYVFEASGICAMQQMVGNAVPVLLAEAIGETVFDHLSQHQTFITEASIS